MTAIYHRDKPDAALSRQRKWQAKMKSSGRCTRCGAKRSKRSISQCDKCLDRVNARYAKKGTS